MNQEDNLIIQKSKRTWEEKKSLCELWKKSGKSKSEFCQEYDITLPTFCGWCDKLWPKSKKEKESDLSPIWVVNQPKPKEEKREGVLIEIVLPNQSLVRFTLPNQQIATFVQELSHATTTLR